MTGMRNCLLSIETSVYNNKLSTLDELKEQREDTRAEGLVASLYVTCTTCLFVGFTMLYL